MRRNAIVIAALIALFGLPARADLEQDKQQIRQAALDYIEGWYEGDAERMERAVHPQLAKRIVTTEANGRSRLDNMSALELVQGARAGWGTRTPKEQQIKQVEIFDVFENVASVKVTARDWIDYLHVARVDGKWVIVNVLWELTPEALAKHKR